MYRSRLQFSFLATMFVILLVGCTSFTPPTPAPDTRDADAKALRQIEADWNQTLANNWNQAAIKDADKVTAYYADDASVFLPGMPVVTGKPNIAAVWKQFQADKNSALGLVTDKVVVSKSGDMGYTQGHYVWTYTDAKTRKAVSEKGEYVEIYMKQADGSWKDIVDTGHLDGPPVPVKM